MKLKLLDGKSLDVSFISFLKFFALGEIIALSAIYIFFFILGFIYGFLFL